MKSFINGSIENLDYSTSETWTGEYWIDGKKIYRKVVKENSTKSIML